MSDRRVGGDSRQTLTTQRAIGMKMSRWLTEAPCRQIKRVKCLTKRWQTVWQNKSNYIIRMKWRNGKPGCSLKGCSCQIMSCRYACGQPHKAARTTAGKKKTGSFTSEMMCGDKIRLRLGLAAFWLRTSVGRLWQCSSSQTSDGEAWSQPLRWD